MWAERSQILRQTITGMAQLLILFPSEPLGPEEHSPHYTWYYCLPDPPRMSQLCLLCSTTFLVYSSKVCHIPPKSNMVRFFTARACFLVSTSTLIACLLLCLKYHNESSLHRASLFWFILLEAEESIMVRNISVSSRHGSRNRSGVILSFFGTKSQGDQTRNRENTYS